MNEENVVPVEVTPEVVETVSTPEETPAAVDNASGAETITA